MPVMKSRLAALKKQYGTKKGQKIYFKMESEGKNKPKKRTSKAKFK